MHIPGISVMTLTIYFLDSDVQARPERLISRLRTISLDDTGPRLIVIRQPRGPEGSKGFSSEARCIKTPGAAPE